MSALTTEDVERLRRALDEQGYVVLRGVVAEAHVDALDVAIREAYRQAPKFKGGGSMTGHLNCYPGEISRQVYEDLAEAGIVDAVRSIRSGRNNDIRITMNFNLPGSVAQHYHTDGKFLDDFLICNVAVVDTEVANGAMDILPGTNRSFLPFWKYATQAHVPALDEAPDQAR